MRIAAMLGDVAKSLFKKPVTRPYPYAKEEAPEQLRGKVEWDAEKCTGCGLCVRDCPAFALELITIDRKAKKFVMRYRADSCTFCAQCVESCRFDAIRLSNSDWELAALNPRPFDFYYGDETHVQSVLAQKSASDAGQAKEA